MSVTLKKTNYLQIRNVVEKEVKIKKLETFKLAFQWIKKTSKLSSKFFSYLLKKLLKLESLSTFGIRDVPNLLKSGDPGESVAHLKTYLYLI